VTKWWPALEGAEKVTHDLLAGTIRVDGCTGSCLPGQACCVARLKLSEGSLEEDHNPYNPSPDSQIAWNHRPDQMHNPAPWLLPFASRATTGPFRHAAVKCARFLGRAIGLAAWLLRGPRLNLSTRPPGLSTCCHREIAFRFDLAQRRSIILDPILFPFAQTL